MKERPILFSAPMVRAILDGSKTQTRRVVKPQPTMYEPGQCVDVSDAINDALKCPYGQPGDRLWVRETWNAIDVFDGDNGLETGSPLAKIPKEKPRRVFLKWAADQNEEGPWRPSIHMPRWASRITLEITEVRVERLHQISRGDAMQEGCPFPNMVKGTNPKEWFADLWLSINGAGSWVANPWVWVVSFKLLDSKAWKGES